MYVAVVVRDEFKITTLIPITIMVIIHLRNCFIELEFIVCGGEDEPVLSDVVSDCQDSQKLTENFYGVDDKNLLIIVNMIRVGVLSKVWILIGTIAHFVKYLIYYRNKHLIAKVVIEAENTESFGDPEELQSTIETRKKEAPWQEYEEILLECSLKVLGGHNTKRLLLTATFLSSLL